MIKDVELQKVQDEGEKLREATQQQDHESKPQSEHSEANARDNAYRVSPITTALLAGLVGLVGTMLGGALNLQVEKKKQEGSLILEAIKTGDKTTAARNLLFFSDAGLLRLSEEQMRNLRKEAGESTLPVLPLPEKFTSLPSSSLPPELNAKLKAALNHFEDYLLRAGFQLEKGEVKFTIVEGNSIKIDGQEFASVYDPDTNTMQVASAYKDYTDLMLHEYMRHVLSPPHRNSPDTSKPSQLWVYYAIQSALADYFPCSSNDNPVLANKSNLSVNLMNRNTFDRISLSDVFSTTEPELPWGGAFWELRQLLTQSKADKLLASVWVSWHPSDPKSNVSADFVHSIIKADESEGGQHSVQIQKIFERRKLKL